LGVECNGVEGDPGIVGRSWGAQSWGLYLSFIEQT